MHPEGPHVYPLFVEDLGLGESNGTPRSPDLGLDAETDLGIGLMSSTLILASRCPGTSPSIARTRSAVGGPP
jgi:hypothetical protein